ncbi:uncharacterized protein TNCV_185701 [Trichonephila clavipes]|nr:uncharacterized protein TNCV_185701 [Trichonephila clavipes]
MNFELGVANSSSGEAHDLTSSLDSGDLYSLIAGVSSVLLNRPGRWSPTFAYMWVDRNGRPVSPPSTHPRSPTFKKDAVKKIRTVSSRRFSHHLHLLPLSYTRHNYQCLELQVRKAETSRNITARVIECDVNGEIHYFLEESRWCSKLANMVTNDAKMFAKVTKLATDLVAKNDANLTLPPRFRQVLIELPL